MCVATLQHSDEVNQLKNYVIPSVSDWILLFFVEKTEKNKILKTKQISIKAE
jgi:hypothetical protein